MYEWETTKRVRRGSNFDYRRELMRYASRLLRAQLSGIKGVPMLTARYIELIYEHNFPPYRVIAW